jgi:hypothetical protein
MQFSMAFPEGDHFPDIHIPGTRYSSQLSKQIISNEPAESDPTAIPRPRSVERCSGMALRFRTPPWQKDFTTANLVFRGKITEVRRISEGPPSHRIIIQFAVTTVWKGRASRQLTMHTELEQAACWGFWPDLVSVGNELLVFAVERPAQWLQWEKVAGFPKGQKTVFTTSICTHTSNWSPTIDAILRQTFGSGQQPVQK